MRVGSSGESLRMLCGLPTPAIQGGTIDAEDAGHQGRAFAFADAFDRQPTPSFQFKGSSDWSAHELLYALH